MKFSELSAPKQVPKINLFVGCRVIWQDAMERYHFGVVYKIINNEKVYVVDDNGQPHSEIPFYKFERYDGWQTEKTTGQKKVLSNLQKRLVERADQDMRPPKYFKRTAMRPWGIPLMRATFAWANKRYFNSRLLIKNRIFPPFGVTKKYGLYGAYFLRTKRIVVNPGLVTNIQRVTVTMIHEMIHMYDHLVNKGLAAGVDPHRQWFQDYAQKVKKDLKVDWIMNVTDNLDVDIGNYDLGITDDDKNKEDEKIRTQLIKAANEKSSSPYYLIVVIDEFSDSKSQGEAAHFFAVRSKDEDVAFNIIDKIKSLNTPIKLAIYEIDLLYFEELIPAAGNMKATNFSKVRRKISLPQLELIQKKGTALDPYGDIISWYIKKSAKLKSAKAKE